MSVKKIKKIIAITFAAGLMLSLPISVSAGSSNNIINGVRVTTTCNQHGSTHYIYKSYGSGSASISYTQNGVAQTISVTGTSQSTYWVATKNLTANQFAYRATTTYSGSTVTAAYP